MTTTDASIHVEVVPLAGEIGAELAGVDTGVALDDSTIVQIRQALLKH